jgi:hypothetical protein
MNFINRRKVAQGSLASEEATYNLMQETYRNSHEHFRRVSGMLPTPSRLKVMNTASLKETFYLYNLPIVRELNPPRATLIRIILKEINKRLVATLDGR